MRNGLKVSIRLNTFSSISCKYSLCDLLKQKKKVSFPMQKDITFKHAKILLGYPNMKLEFQQHYLEIACHFGNVNSVRFKKERCLSLSIFFIGLWIFLLKLESKRNVDLKSSRRVICKMFY